MMREMGCQMDVGLGKECEKTGLYMDTRKDKIIKPNKNSEWKLYPFYVGMYLT